MFCCKFLAEYSAGKNLLKKFSNSHKGRWYENTDMACRRCGNPVYESDNPEYRYQCFQCDEDLYSFEVIRQERKEYQNGHR